MLACEELNGVTSQALDGRAGNVDKLEAHRSQDENLAGNIYIYLAGGDCGSEPPHAEHI